MNSYSQKRYLNAGLAFLCAFAAFIVAGIVLTFIIPGKIAPEIGLIIGTIVGAVVCIPFSAYNFVCCFVYGQRCGEADTVTGTVCGIEAGKLFFLCGVTVRSGEKEYSSPVFFGRIASSKLLGRKVSFCLVDGIAIIIKVL